MQTINVRDEDRRGQEEEEDVAHEEVRAPQRQFNDLHDELTRGLGHGMRAEAAAVPLARPPRAVRLVMLEFTRQEHGNQELVNRTLDMNDRNETQNRM